MKNSIWFILFLIMFSCNPNEDNTEYQEIEMFYGTFACNANLKSTSPEIDQSLNHLSEILKDTFLFTAVNLDSTIDKQELQFGQWDLVKVDFTTEAVWRGSVCDTIMGRPIHVFKIEKL